MITDIRNFRSR